MANVATIPRVKLPTNINELPEQRYGHWILAGTPGNEPYPCTCRYSPCRWEKCQGPLPDRGPGTAGRLLWARQLSGGRTRVRDSPETG